MNLVNPQKSNLPFRKPNLNPRKLNSKPLKKSKDDSLALRRGKTLPDTLENSLPGALGYEWRIVNPLQWMRIPEADATSHNRGANPLTYSFEGKGFQAHLQKCVAFAPPFLPHMAA